MKTFIAKHLARALLTFIRWLIANGFDRKDPKAWTEMILKLRSIA
jgi:hypothetical protein